MGCRFPLPQSPLDTLEIVYELFDFHLQDNAYRTAHRGKSVKYFNGCKVSDPLMHVK